MLFQYRLSIFVLKVSRKQEAGSRKQFRRQEPESRSQEALSAALLEGSFARNPGNGGY